MKEAIYLLPVLEETETTLIEIRSQMNHALVGLLGQAGLYYWERRSHSRLLLPKADILTYLQEKKDDPLSS